MGNRGCIHPGTERRITRRWTTRSWIACVLEFKGWKAPMFEAGRWTPLFFLDEATALAAGHRPCALCRRADHKRFRAAWGEAPLAEIDLTLHTERTGPRRTVRADDLTTGAMVEVDGVAHLVVDGSLRPWSSEGYGSPRSLPPTVTLLTPPSLLDVLWRGYEPLLHPTAGR